MSVSCKPSSFPFPMYSFCLKCVFSILFQKEMGVIARSFPVYSSFSVLVFVADCSERPHGGVSVHSTLFDREIEMYCSKFRS